MVSPAMRPPRIPVRSTPMHQVQVVYQVVQVVSQEPE